MQKHMSTPQFRPGDYADYTWPRTFGRPAIRVQILEQHPLGYLVRLGEPLYNHRQLGGGNAIKAGRIHICGADWLEPAQTDPAKEEIT